MVCLAIAVNLMPIFLTTLRVDLGGRAGLTGEQLGRINRPHLCRPRWEAAAPSVSRRREAGAETAERPAYYFPGWSRGLPGR
jgi:hypothetical protein